MENNDSAHDVTPVRLRLVRACFAIIVLSTGIGAALAQAERTDRAVSGAAAPALGYESAFSDYRAFREPGIGSWQEANKEVAEAARASSTGGMKHMPGMEAKSGDAPKGSEGGAGHHMAPSTDTPAKPMPGAHKHAARAPKPNEGAADHHASSMKDKTSLAMVKPHTGPSHPADARTARLIGTGIVRAIDKAKGRVKLTHDPISAMGWPRMTLYFRLKDRSLADQLKEGENVQFSLEQSATGYVISAFHKGEPSHGMK